MLASQAIFVDDTPVKMLAPGTGKTAKARLWAYGRDERPWGSDVPPASWYQARSIFDDLETWLHAQELYGNLGDGVI